MESRKEKYSKSFFFSVLFHVVIISIFIVSFDFSSPPPVLQNTNQNTEIINAMVLDSPPTPSAKSTKIVDRPVSPTRPVSPPVRPVSPPAPTPQEKPKIEQIAQKTIAIPDKNLKKLQQEKIAQQLLADLQSQTEKQKKLKQKQVKQKEVAAAFAKEIKNLAERSLQQQMQQEQKRIAGARAQQTQGIVDKYKALILQAISQNWLVPSNVNKKLFAELLIRVAPGGVVLDVQVIKSSGDEGLDRSARTAVLKASPLPVPSDADAFEPFRQFVLKVKPENVLTQDAWMG